jgi:anaerobic magnesium-protoporphyrin IX monomethyl ester cyclase
MCLTNMRHAAFRMSELAGEAGATVIISSSDATDQYENYLNNGADYVILGEGEETLSELITSLEAKDAGQSDSGEINHIAGLAYKTPDNKVCHSRRPAMKDLDKLPLPAWDMLDFAPYRKTWLKNQGYFSLNVYTTRGCPFKCNWCAKPLYGNRYHARSPEHVVRELVWLQELAGFDHIWFCDDILGLKPGWLESFADKIRESRLRFKFSMQGRADLLCREEDVKALSRAGCETVWMGAESGSQKVLDAMEKGQKVEQIYEAVRLLRKWSIKPALFLQFGYPGETTTDIRKTVQMLKDLMPDDIGISVSYPLPGTSFYDKVQNELGDKANWTDSDDLALMFRSQFSPSFYKRLHRFVHYYFRTLQSRAAWRHLLNNKSVYYGNLRRLITLAPYYFIRSGLELGMLKVIRPGFKHI